MEVQPQCYPCFLRQAVDITELTNADPQRSIAIIEEAMRLILSRHDMDTPPSFVGFLYEQLHQVFFSDQHIFDPYKDIKQKTTDHALNLVDHLRTFVHSSDDPLLAAVTTAIAGNVIDFGASKADTIDIDKEVQELYLK